LNLETVRKTGFVNNVSWNNASLLQLTFVNSVTKLIICNEIKYLPEDLRPTIIDEFYCSPTGGH